MVTVSGPVKNIQTQGEIFAQHSHQERQKHIKDIKTWILRIFKNSHFYLQILMFAYLIKINMELSDKLVNQNQNLKQKFKIEEGQDQNQNLTLNMTELYNWGNQQRNKAEISLQKQEQSFNQEKQAIMKLNQQQKINGELHEKFLKGQQEKTQLCNIIKQRCMGRFDFYNYIDEISIWLCEQSEQQFFIKACA